MSAKRSWIKQRSHFKHKDLRKLDNFITCQQKRAHSKRFLEFMNRGSWKSLCNSPNRDSSSPYIWIKIRKFNGTYLDLSNQNKNQIPTFLSNLFPPFVENMPPSCEVVSFNHFLVQPLTSPGFDHITYELLLRLPDTTRNLLLLAFNNMQMQGEKLSEINKVVDEPITKAKHILTVLYRLCLLFSRLVKD